MARRPPESLKAAGTPAVAPACCRVLPGAVELEVLVVPRASRTRVAGIQEGRLKVQLAAPPVDGEANAALVEFVAELFGVRRSAVTLVAGAASRRKRLRVAGADPARLTT
ncbi:MAG: DUF167 domain-containing protein [Steroidobacteraceae bacterium]|nr:DUF167 domain-containing protein [Steroidobacteraceae bacterium]